MKAGRSARDRPATAGASDAVAFSFYATKNLTTGEGGMITTHRPALADRRCGCSRCTASATTPGTATPTAADWHYDVLAHGFKYNLSDIQAALGIHQLRKLDQFIERRALYAADVPRCIRAIWKRWSFRPTIPAAVMRGTSTFCASICSRLKIDRGKFIRELQQRGIGTSVHFIPIPLLRYFCAAAAGAVCLSARARAVSADCLAAVVSGDDRGAGPLCGPECPGDCAEVRDERSWWRRTRSRRPSRRTPRTLLTPRRGAYENHRNIDVWLERACHLTAVGLSVTAAFLLRFDFSHSRRRDPHSEASAADCDSGEAADLRLGRLLPQSAPLRQHPGSVPGLSRQCGRLASSSLRSRCSGSDPRCRDRC